MNNSSSNVADFKLVVPLVKSEREGGWYIRGVAAGIEPDLQDDVLLPQAIKMLAEQINTGQIPFRNQHRVDSITEDLGYLVKATINDNWQLEFEAELDQDNPEAQYLWRKVGQGKQYGSSIRGQSVGWYLDSDKATGKRVRKHPYVVLSEVSATTRPVYTPSLGTVLRKAIDEGNTSVANEGETMSTSANTGDGTNNDTAQSSAPETDTTVVEKSTLTPSQQLVKDLMADDGFVTLIKASVAEATKVEKPADDSTEVAAAPEATQDIAEIVKSTITAVSQSFEAKLVALANKIPETTGPGVLEKSQEETVEDILTSLKDDPRARLRLGLAARSGELDKVR